MDQEVIKYGKNFEFLLASEGWKQVEQLLDTFEKDALDNLTQYMGSDDHQLRVKQIAHLAVKRTNESLKAHIQGAILNAHEAIRQKEMGGYDGGYLNE